MIQASQTGLRSGAIPRGNPARTRLTSPCTRFS